MKTGKKYIALCMMLAAASLTFTGCSFEDDDYFTESASLRIEHANDQIQTILSAPSNGWVMQYYCGTSVAHFEGFNLFAAFDKNQKVTLAGNHRMLRDGNAGKYTEYESVYSLLLEDGPVLAFNTWNDVLSPFVDPVSPWLAPGTLSKDGAGMAGDNNFVVMSYNANEVILRGERYGAQVRLVPCDREWEDYIAACDKTRNDLTNTTITSYYITAGTDTLYLTGLRNGRVRYSERLDDPLKNDSLASLFTPTGIRFERETSFGNNTPSGYTFQEFTVAADSTCLLSSDGTVKISAIWDKQFSETPDIWTIDTLSLTDDLKALCRAIDAALTAANRNNSLARIGIGRTTNANNVTGLVVEWYTNTRKTSRAMGGIAIKRSMPASSQVTYTTDEEAIMDNNMRGRKQNVIDAALQFALALNGTYNMTPDSYFNPKRVTLNAVSGNKALTITR